MKPLTILLLFAMLICQVEAKDKPHKAKKQPRVDRVMMASIKANPRARQFLPVDTTSVLVSLSVEDPVSYNLYESSEEWLFADSSVVGKQSRFIALFNYKNDPNNRPYTKSGTESLWRSVGSFYQSASYGLSTLEFVVADWITVPWDNTDATARPYTYVDSVARTLGYAVDSYTDKIYISPTGGIHNLNGVTSVSIASDQTIVTTIALQGYGGDIRVAEHEYGHSLNGYKLVGLKHANGLGCTTGGICTHTEYGDYDDVMGRSNTFVPNAGHKYHAGWLTPNVVTTSGAFTLTPADNNATGSALVIRRAPYTFTKAGYLVNATGVYVIEYRPSRGVFLRSMPDNDTPFKEINSESQYGTQLMRVLSAGQSYYDNVLALNLVVNSTTSSGANVSVTFGEPPPPPPPVPATFNCVNWICTDPLDGSGQYTTLVDCQAACVAPPPPAPDTTYPVVSILAPKDGDQIPLTRGNPTMLISASAIDQNLATAVLLIDGKQMQVYSIPSFSYSWQTKKVTFGNHLITVVARDVSGNVSTKTITVRK